MWAIYIEVVQRVCIKKCHVFGVLVGVRKWKIRQKKLCINLHNNKWIVAQQVDRGINTNNQPNNPTSVD